MIAVTTLGIEAAAFRHRLEQRRLAAAVLTDEERDLALKREVDPPRDGADTERAKRQIRYGPKQTILIKGINRPHAGQDHTSLPTRPVNQGRRRTAGLTLVSATASVLRRAFNCAFGLIVSSCGGISCRPNLRAEARRIIVSLAPSAPPRC